MGLLRALTDGGDSCGVVLEDTLASGVGELGPPLLTLQRLKAGICQSGDGEAASRSFPCAPPFPTPGEVRLEHACHPAPILYPTRPHPSFFLFILFGAGFLSPDFCSQQKQTSKHKSPK